MTGSDGDEVLVGPRNGVGVGRRRHQWNGLEARGHRCRCELWIVSERVCGFVSLEGNLTVAGSWEKKTKQRKLEISGSNREESVFFEFWRRWSAKNPSSNPLSSNKTLVLKFFPLFCFLCLFIYPKKQVDFWKLLRITKNKIVGFFKKKKIILQD